MTYKCFAGIMLLCQMTLCVHAQSSHKRSFQVTIPDAGIITSVTPLGNRHISLTATDAGLQDIFDRYQIIAFYQAYPSSRFDFMHHVYRIEVDTGNILQALKSYNRSWFTSGMELTPSLLCSKPLPNDYGLLNTPPGQGQLDYINACAAWDISQGNPGVVIGITDSYFDTAHPDMHGQWATIRTNDEPDYDPVSGVFSYTAWKHGTVVSGMAAARTNNDTGWASIGWNCRLDVSSVYGNDSEVLRMSLDGRRILNCSWAYYDCDHVYGTHDIFEMQNLYNEIYENGAVAFFGAGNTGVDDFQCGQEGYLYPATLDHNMCIAAMGWDKAPGTYTGGKAVNWRGAHSIYADDTSVAWHHHDRVDLCAPTYILVGNNKRPDRYDPYDYNLSATSYAAPICAGAAGLMVSANSYLSPYQIEYLMKKTANPDMLGFYYNMAYAGKLGWGRLDAGAAVTLAKSHNPNNKLTQTLFVKGIELNTICQPGKTSNGIRPQLRIIHTNGKAPFTYKWEPIEDSTPGGNNTTLDRYDTDTPTIMTSAGNHLAYYRVTVFDGTDVQKIASRVVRIQLTNEAGYDLAMRDAYVDMLDEPNTQASVDPREWDIWQSPDVWNRITNDGKTTHQDPVFVPLTPNYAYVRVRNVGCATSSAKKVRLYWSKASTGEDWPADWTTTTLPSPYTGLPLPGGQEITSSPLTVPVLEPGESVLLSHSWYPQDPKSYDTSTNKFAACFLARITESESFPYGMSAPEDTLTKRNVLNNNNIVTRNMIVGDLGWARGSSTTGPAEILIANPDGRSRVFTFEVISDRTINRHFAGSLTPYGSCIIRLGDVFDAWVSGGAVGTYAAINTNTKSVIFDGSNPVRLEHITLNPRSHHPIAIEFKLNDSAMIEDTASLLFHFRQFVTDGTPELYGAVNYHVNLYPGEGAGRYTAKNTIQEKGGKYLVYPTVTNGDLTIEYAGHELEDVMIMILDISGRSIFSAKYSFAPSGTTTIKLDGLSPGMYFVRLTGDNDADAVYKVIKQ